MRRLFHDHALEWLSDGIEELAKDGIGVDARERRERELKAQVLRLEPLSGLPRKARLRRRDFDVGQVPHAFDAYPLISPARADRPSTDIGPRPSDLRMAHESVHRPDIAACRSVPCMDGARGAREKSDISAKRRVQPCIRPNECGRCGRWP